MKEYIVPFIVRTCITVASIIAFCFCLSLYLDRQIEVLYKECMTTVNHSNGVSEKDKGNTILKWSMDECKLLLMGSSELTSLVPENPKNLFPNNKYDGDINLVGHAYVQNALHAINLGANSSLLNGKDIVIIESLQWFTGDDIENDGFFSNFSELQFYEFLNNNQITDDNKKYLCERYIRLEDSNSNSIFKDVEKIAGNSSIVVKLTDEIENTGYNLVRGDAYYPQTYLLACMYISNNPVWKCAYYLAKPYYELRYHFFILKDKFSSYIWLKGLAAEEPQKSVDINWGDMYEVAEQEGMTACTNNDFNVYDEYYSRYLENNLNGLKGMYSKEDLIGSDEWNDYNFFLSVCNDLNIRPFIVLMSTNGIYYDYTGLDKMTRDRCYNTLESMANEYGMNCLNLSANEYEPYFFIDVMHLGWKGWTYVVQSIVEHFSQ